MEKVSRIIGTGPNPGTSGVPAPQHLDPPHRFFKSLQIICVNNDVKVHYGEVYANGYDVFRIPDDPSAGEW